MDMDESGDVGDCTQDGSCGDDEVEGEDDDVGQDIDLSLMAETQNALQQFSIVVGVCLMVGILFFLLIAIETTYDWIITKLKNMVGTKKTSDPEDPASLVGSFKRYKN